MAAHPPPNYSPPIYFHWLALIPLFFFLLGKWKNTNNNLLLPFSSMDMFKWQWKITPQGLFSSPDNRGLKTVRVMCSMVEAMHIRMRVMHIMSTLHTKMFSTETQGIRNIFEITTISKPAQLYLFLICLVSCHQKQHCLFSHSSDSLKKEAQQATT